jgi:RNA polymerase sigma factor (sigma-70 family)
MEGRTGQPNNGPEELLAAAARGEQLAWNHLVERYGRLVWSVARGFRLSDSDAADVCQTTWLRLVEHMDSIADPDRLAGWLATTARREAIRTLRHGEREILVFDDTDEPDPDQPDPAHSAVAKDEYRALWTAFIGLSERCQALLRIVAVGPVDSYADLASTLAMPIGSIGPTKARCLDRLRACLAP